MKRFKLLGANATPDEGAFDHLRWDLCLLCQTVKKEALQCPNDSKRPDKGVGYKSLADVLQEFSMEGELPSWLSLADFDEGCGIDATFSRHNAKWHKSCRNLYNKAKVDRLRKRKLLAMVDDIDEKESTVAGCSTNQTMAENVDRLTRSSCSLTSTLYCLFCDKSESDADGPLHQVTSFDVDCRVRNCARILQDSKLLGKLSVGDLIAVEARYHARCLVALYNRAAACDREPAVGMSNNFSSESLAFAQLVEYISEVKNDSTIAPVFKLSDLVKMYHCRLQQLNVTTDARVHSTRLKNKLLSQFPGMTAKPHGKEVLLAFDSDLADALSHACQFDSDVNASVLVKAAHILRRDIANVKYKFSGEFSVDCQETSVPQSLLTFIQMILEGASIDSHADMTCVPATESITQLIVFNSVKHKRKNKSAQSVPVAIKTRHSASRETPLPLYLSMMMHAETRKRDLVDKLFHLGLCVSYDRLLQVSANLANRISDRFDVVSGICPPPLRAGLFTTAAVDNIDHNPTSTTAVDAFHGTGISLVQHYGHNEQGTAIEVCSDELNGRGKTVQQLPSSYVSLPPIGSIRKDLSVPESQFSLENNNEHIQLALQTEYNWLNSVHTKIEESTANTEDSNSVSNFSWSAYNANMHSTHTTHSDVSVLLPLFRDPAHSPAMMCHAMTIIASAVGRVNPGQVPVLTVDQPLYTLAKQIQWNWPERFGESKFVLVLGALHIEMAMLKTMGDWLDGSGWVGALVSAGITSSGRGEAMLHASHVMRSRHAHQVTAASLYILQQRAYLEYVCKCADDDNDGPVLNFTDWREAQCKLHPQFHYWYIVLKLELLLLSFIRSLRQSNFDLFVEALTNLVPWFFSMNHQNYARWASVHLRDMMMLSTLHPDIACQFRSGKFTVNVTGRPFSAIGLDQAHEQLNARVKGVGGAVGLTENPEALLRWMIAGPEVARVVSEFERASGIGADSENSCHHEQTQGQQTLFLKQVSSLVETFQEMGNPFADDGNCIYALDTHNVCSDAVTETVRTIEALGQDQFNTFLTDRLIERTVLVTAPLPRNKLNLFKYSSTTTRSTKNSKLAASRNDCSLFSRLYIACQTRSGDLDTFFSHENQPAPPSLSSDGNLRLSSKSDLLTCLEALMTKQQKPSEANVLLDEGSAEQQSPAADALVVAGTTVEKLCPEVDALVLDGAAIVQMLHPVHCKTFADYATKVFVPYIRSQLTKVNRLDLVWDQYLTDSLKTTTRVKRGSGMRRRVMPSGELPRNWSDFLHNDANKTELFHFLSTCVAAIQLDTDKQLFVTDGSHVLTINVTACPDLDPCSHEEADTRMLLHVAHAAKTGHAKVMIRTVDTDVAVIAIGCFQRLPDISELWLAFGTGKYFRYISIHDIAQSLGNERACSLPFFHAFTGCDTVSSFTGRGKKTAWETWNAFPEVTATFKQLSSQPPEVETTMPMIQRFVVLMYDRSSSKMTVNGLRKHLFTKKCRSMEGIPPTEAALLQHTKRAALQSGYCWNRSLQSQQSLPSPSEWGWTKGDDDDGIWKPLWTTLPVVAECCPELLKCGCKKGCNKRCKCMQAKTKCTALCNCDGLCFTETSGSDTVDLS